MTSFSIALDCCRNCLSLMAACHSAPFFLHTNAAAATSARPPTAAAPTIKLELSVGAGSLFAGGLTDAFTLLFAGSCFSEPVAVELGVAEDGASDAVGATATVASGLKLPSGGAGPAVDPVKVILPPSGVALIEKPAAAAATPDSPPPLQQLPPVVAGVEPASHTVTRRPQRRRCDGLRTAVVEPTRWRGIRGVLSHGARNEADMGVRVVARLLEQ
mmetsp:Transcript_7404/g.27181  ORF Transcript_7404/g.27181 Transcript_7404/m.27181 type:complete len:216 (+) Transcript_7404:2052-2699(+)